MSGADLAGADVLGSTPGEVVPDEVVPDGAVLRDSATWVAAEAGWAAAVEAEMAMATEQARLGELRDEQMKQEEEAKRAWLTGLEQQPRYDPKTDVAPTKAVARAAREAWFSKLGIDAPDWRTLGQIGALEEGWAPEEGWEEGEWGES